MDDHDLLVRIDERLGTTVTRFDEHLTQSERVHGKQDARIATLEQWKWRWAGAIGILGFFISLIGSILGRNLVP